jgi:hypothetical protein
MASTPSTTVPERRRRLSSSDVQLGNTPPHLASATDRPNSQPKLAPSLGVPALEKKTGIWSGEFTAKGNLQAAELSEGRGDGDDWLSEVGYVADGGREAWMSFRPEGSAAESAVFAGAHVPSSPGRKLWVRLTVTCSEQDLLVRWGIQVHLKVFTERYGRHNPATLNLSFPSSGVNGDDDPVPPLSGLRCDLLAGVVAEQFSTRFDGHPAYARLNTRSNLVLIEFDSAKGFFTVDDLNSAPEAELLNMSTEHGHLGPGLTDALVAFRSAASMAGHVQIVAYMTVNQQRRLGMKTVPAMAKGFELVKLLKDEEGI